MGFDSQKPQMCANSHRVITKGLFVLDPYAKQCRC